MRIQILPKIGVQNAIAEANQFSHSSKPNKIVHESYFAIELIESGSC
jgi:hypothetical protein